MVAWATGTTAGLLDGDSGGTWIVSVPILHGCAVWLRMERNSLIMEKFYYDNDVKVIEERKEDNTMVTLKN